MARSKVLGTVAAASVFSMAGMVLAGRPLAIDDADPTDAGQFEFEVGASYIHESDCRHWDFPFGLIYGLLPRVEASLGFGGQFEEQTERLEESGTDRCRHEGGIGDLAIGAKWQLIETCPFGARHALMPTVKLPTADDDKGLGSGETDCDLTWVTSRDLGEKAGAHLNFGYSWIGGPDDNVLHYGLAIDYQIVNAIQWVGEVFAAKELTTGTDTVVQYNTGLRWNPTDSLTLDIAGGSKLSGDAPDLTATAGLTWAFGFGNN